MPSMKSRDACATGLPPMSPFTMAKKRDGSKSNTTETMISTVYLYSWEFRFSEKCRSGGGQRSLRARTTQIGKSLTRRSRRKNETSSVEEKNWRLVGIGRGLVFRSLFHRLQLPAKRH